nr:restriction endonuclease subunit S [uncultured Flavobacterium sp.]
MINKPKWQTKTLGEVCEIKSGKNQKKVINPNGKYPIYGSSGIFGYADEYICDENTTIIGRKGTINSPIYVTTKFWNVDTAFGLCAKEDLNSKFLYYFCLGFNFKKLDKSTTIPSLSKGDLLSIELNVPPLETQQAIVSKIEELFSELDKGIEGLKTAQQQLKIYRQSVLKWAFEGKLINENVKEGELPEGWEMTKMSKIITLSSLKHKPETIENLFYIGLEHIEKHAGRLKSTVGIEKITTVKNKFSIGDILYGKLRPNLNKVYLSKEEGVCSTDILVLKLAENCLGKYLHQIMISRPFVNEMSENTSGVNLPRVSTKFIMNYEVPLPPLEEQHLIVQEIESRLSVADKMEESIAQSLQQAEALRQSILKKAFSGELIS